MNITKCILFFVVALSLGGCSFLTDVDTSFLIITEPEDDAGQPDCEDVGEIETREACFDGCDNDLDTFIDCDDDECEHYCCEFFGVERISCEDQCDNDRDALIDCEDPDCMSETHCSEPPEPETECSNGDDDDLDGLTDCQDDDCSATEFCCGTETPHVDRDDGELDEDYWGYFERPYPPDWSDEKLVVDWNDIDGIYGGAATDDPINLDFGLRINFTTIVTEETTCFSPWDCDGFSGIALARSRVATTGQNPDIHLSVLVTSGRRVVVTRGQIGSGRILHTMGLQPPLPGDETDPIYSITVDLMPASNEFGENGYRMRLSAPLGVEVCHEDGTILGCGAEPEWVSDELAVHEENAVLLNDERGNYLMVLGHGSAVKFSDRESETISVSLRSCANPTAWEPAGPDDRVGNDFLCWAVAGLGSGSVVPTYGSTIDYAMVVEGTTEEILAAGLGTNNFSLGWLDIQGDDDLQQWHQMPELGNSNSHRGIPIDTNRDLNCEGLDHSDWPDDTCETLTMMESPADEDEDCQVAKSHRSPHVIVLGSGDYRILYSEATAPNSLRYEIAAADYTERRNEWNTDDLGLDHRLTALDVQNDTDLLYRSLRDPAAICHPDFPVTDCPVYMVLFVGEPDSSSGGEWTGDDVLYAKYDVSAGFSTINVVLDGNLQDANPLARRYLSEPWMIWDERTGQYFIWITSNLPYEAPQVDLFTVTPAESSGADYHPLVPRSDETPGAIWTLYPGSPVLTVRDLELLWPTEDHRAAECSGSCEIGGVTGVVVPNPGDGRDTLHMWVSVAERPATDDSPVFHLRHLVQPFGIP